MNRVFPSRLARKWSIRRLVVPAGLGLCAPLLFSPLRAEEPPALPKPAPVTWGNPVQDKNFYLLSLWEGNPEVRKLLAETPELKTLVREKVRRLALPPPPVDPARLPELLAGLQWSDEEVEKVAGVLRRLYQASPALQSQAREDMRSCGLFQLYRKLTDEELLVRAWRDAAQGMNGIIRVYGGGAEPLYPLIDSLAYDPHSLYYAKSVQAILGAIQDEPAFQELFFQPSLHFAVTLLQANQRDDAGQFEPLEKGENAAARRHAEGMDWARYPYSAIVVLGQGPQLAGVTLSPAGRANLISAARRYREGKAPFLLLSGGCVHPAGTRICEALEMKKALMAEYGIPEEAILIEPHARHTTTNLRNAARLLYRYNIPLEKKVCVLSTADHIRHIDQRKFEKRCRAELGYLPHEIVGRPSPLELECTLQLESLHANSRDPLDP